MTYSGGMGELRDKMTRLLPSRLLDHDDLRGRATSRLVRDFYGEPANAVEKEAHAEWVDRGWGSLRKGWPDFLVFADQDDFFVVEVKGPNDYLRPAQRVVLETLARKGIDAYVRWGENSYEAIGQSRSWASRDWKTRA